MCTALITAHAVFASVALVATIRARRPRWFAVYEVSLVLMLLFLAAAIVADSASRDTARHAVSWSLVALGAVMVVHAELARRTRDEASTRFTDHVGFTVVGLIDAFVVVTVFNAGVPGWVTRLSVWRSPSSATWRSSPLVPERPAPRSEGRVS